MCVATDKCRESLSVAPVAQWIKLAKSTAVHIDTAEGEFGLIWLTWLCVAATLGVIFCYKVTTKNM